MFGRYISEAIENGVYLKFRIALKDEEPFKIDEVIIFCLNKHKVIQNEVIFKLDRLPLINPFEDILDEKMSKLDPMDNIFKLKNQVR